MFGGPCAYDTRETALLRVPGCGIGVSLRPYEAERSLKVFVAGVVVVGILIAWVVAGGWVELLVLKAAPYCVFGVVGAALRRDARDRTCRG